MGHSGQTVPKQNLANVKQEGQIKSHMRARGTQGETVPQASSARYPVNFRTKLVLKLPRVQSSLAERIRKGSNPKQWPTFQARVSPSPWSDGPTLHACTENVTLSPYIYTSRQLHLFKCAFEGSVQCPWCAEVRALLPSVLQDDTSPPPCLYLPFP